MLHGGKKGYLMFTVCYIARCLVMVNAAFIGRFNNSGIFMNIGAAAVADKLMLISSYLIALGDTVHFFMFRVA